MLGSLSSLLTNTVRAKVEPKFESVRTQSLAYIISAVLGLLAIFFFATFLWLSLAKLVSLLWAAAFMSLFFLLITVTIISLAKKLGKKKAQEAKLKWQIDLHDQRRAFMAANAANGIFQMVRNKSSRKRNDKRDRHLGPIKASKSSHTAKKWSILGIATASTAGLLGWLYSRHKK